MWNRLSMKTKLIIFFIGIAAIPLALTTLISSYLTHEALTRAVFDDAKVVASSVSREIDGVLNEKVRALTAAANTADVQSGDREKQLQAIKNVGKQYPDMNEVAITDNTGNWVVRIDNATAPGIGERPYFQKLKNGADFAFSDVIVPKGRNTPAIIVAVAIKDAQNNFKGAVTGVVDLQKLSQSLEKIKIGDSGYVILLDQAGKIIVHPDKSLIQQELPPIEPVKAGLNGGTGAMAYAFDGAKKLAGYSNVPVSGWVVLANQPLDEAMSGASKVQNTGIGLTVAAILLATLAGLLIATSFTKPLRQLVDATKLLAEGDLTVKVVVKTKDEMGQLADSFNSMVHNLRKLIRGVLDSAEQVAASAEELSATSNEAERSVDTISCNIAELAQGSQQQTSEVEKTLTVGNHLEQVALTVVEKARLTAEVSAEMTVAAEDGKDAAQNAVNKIYEIKSVTASAATVVTMLGEKSQHIGQMLDTITQIAAQTNLLALNAAIEAARAGEQGRGFAVVADEVRKLAEQSHGAAQEIALIVREIQGQTAEAISAMHSGNDKVNDGVTVVQNTGQALENILTKINNSVHMIGDINDASKEQLQEIKTMVVSTDQVAVIARTSSANTTETAATSEEILASMKDISNAANALATMASEMQSMTSSFKI